MLFWSVASRDHREQDEAKDEAKASAKHIETHPRECCHGMRHTCSVGTEACQAALACRIRTGRGVGSGSARRLLYFLSFSGPNLSLAAQRSFPSLCSLFLVKCLVHSLANKRGCWICGQCVDNYTAALHDRMYSRARKVTTVCGTARMKVALNPLYNPLAPSLRTAIGRASWRERVVCSV